jgi:hypothetical protein
MSNETMTKNGKYWNDRKMRKIEAIDFFWLCVYLLFLGDQNNLNYQINGEDQPCHWLDDCKLVWWFKETTFNHLVIKSSIEWPPKKEFCCWAIEIQ